MNDFNDRNSAPIGIFDSGVGGLSVWREVARSLPAESTWYIADQAHIPYGPRPAEALRGYAENIAGFLIDSGCKAIVVACNAASAAALKHLRERFPATPFIGMEPAIKPAAAATKTRTIAVLATPATLAGELFNATAQRFAQGARVIGEPCPGLVEAIEAGHAATAETAAMLRRFLAPALNQNADHVVLACTHYPFVIDAIRRIVGAGVEVIDPAPAVVRQLARILGKRGLLADHAPIAIHRFFTTAATPDGLQNALREWVSHPATVECLHWNGTGNLKLSARSATLGDHTMNAKKAINAAYRERVYACLAALGADPELITQRQLPLFADARTLSCVGLGTDGRDKFLTPPAAAAWLAMRAAAEADGVPLLLISAFRSFDYQLGLIRGKLAKGRDIDEILTVNAPPGCSEHHSGYAVDIGADDIPALEEAFEDTQSFAWLSANASRFGFELSYPRHNDQGYLYEPWHWCFQGV